MLSSSAPTGRLGRRGRRRAYGLRGEGEERRAYDLLLIRGGYGLLGLGLDFTR